MIRYNLISDDQLLEMKKLAEYVQQVLEEAKNRLTTPTATPTTDYYETVDCKINVCCYDNIVMSLPFVCSPN